MEVVVSCEPEIRDMLIATLSNFKYDSFLETDEGLNAYVEERMFDEEKLKDILYSHDISESYSFRLLEDKNWNEEWERNFEPVAIEDLCLIRAPFHDNRQDYFRYEIVVQPKMSFGTGHHATTYLMIKSQINRLDHNGKKVLDCGCGTGILAIMANKLGATKVVANDIDDWSIENARENIEANACDNIRIVKGSIEELASDSQFDIILANINRNILLSQMNYYSKNLVKHGQLLISGFYDKDAAAIDEEASRHGFVKVAYDQKDRWGCILYKKAMLA